MGSREWKEPDHHLCDPWPCGPFLRRKHDPAKLSERAVRGNAGRNLGHATATFIPLLDGFWKARFPGQIDATLAIAEELDGGVIRLEDEEMVSIPAGHTDTHSTTCLHVPSIGLVVAGDVAYNDVHIYLAESNTDSRKEWIAALDVIEGLKPSVVVAGHKRPGRADSPAIIEETRQYIRAFGRIAAGSPRLRRRFTARCSRFIPIV
jgi:glyoxylase-like metal-dependent hydrolase (beta-lactamase superfamily II)